MLFIYCVQWLPCERFFSRDPTVLPHKAWKYLKRDKLKTLDPRSVWGTPSVLTECFPAVYFYDNICLFIDSLGFREPLPVTKCVCFSVPVKLCSHPKPELRSLSVPPCDAGRDVFRPNKAVHLIGIWLHLFYILQCHFQVLLCVESGWGLNQLAL